MARRRRGARRLYFKMERGEKTKEQLNLAMLRDLASPLVSRRL
jgi:hypothetical protein